MFKGISTNLIIEASNLRFNVAEIDNELSGKSHLIFSTCNDEIELFSLFILTDDTFQWERNISLPDTTLKIITLRQFINESELLELLCIVHKELLA
ncbi:hypothetical protein ED841_02865 [Escherichia coli]|uniref:hypothetical protein n=1 Tax=Escherichia coli TaxID=562 RepID=UPI0010B21D40|nr:hypothetical protein [Escherichia coli]EEW7962583.1 hypothetical protein [Escherichia coli]EFA5346762.1 hypothetical protein [Escherichia coli]EFB2911873.1 hypothetical protein [Escherichia coli]EFC6945912.1 hypothetical protein [Escherichia coli]EFD0677828.1 hypothetical protein [Escherichia coli]